MQTNESFYQELSSFNDFQRAFEENYYQQLPKNWMVFITDIKGSTQAIDEGRYRDVNRLGAATIVCVQNALRNFDFPYVFGGDGASFAIPESYCEVVKEKLLSLQDLSKQNFNLELRVGAIAMSDLRERGVGLQVAKYEVGHGKCIALFKGGGLTKAEDLIKEEQSPYLIQGESRSDADLKGLSCRWQPISSKRGVILSLLVKTKPGVNDQIYTEIFSFIDKYVGKDSCDQNPIKIDHMKYQSVKQCLGSEIRYHKSWLALSFLARALEIIFAVAVFKHKLKPLIFDPDSYAKSMENHSDYKKFDDMFRMVVDCTHEESQKIEKHLKELHQQGHIYYGIHRSQNSLMTCFVNDIKPGQHIHFVDGADGGYAMAAKELKKQIYS